MNASIVGACASFFPIPSIMSIVKLLSYPDCIQLVFACKGKWTNYSFIGRSRLQNWVYVYTYLQVIVSSCVFFFKDKRFWKWWTRMWLLTDISESLYVLVFISWHCMGKLMWWVTYSILRGMWLRPINDKMTFLLRKVTICQKLYSIQFLPCLFIWDFATKILNSTSFHFCATIIFSSSNSDSINVFFPFIIALFIF